ncbi:hypothetical protein JOF56_005102 [Kibdelosporangium banguiense]|uniref:Uncharacterized protein n=1 Tax=Kibdelosporangium banguiense TaxID=1365924 RepID=A0ABS4TJX2_9PSEU|nr:hypothetical protein [Kibdelosporangium banguiense]MBP2324717.1 hypothetical protein [Kibdelosporangium banguiense]
MRVVPGKFAQALVLLDETEVKLGIRLDAEVGAAIARGHGGSFEITHTRRAGPHTSGTQET